jgi:hypothetical protein
MSRGESNFFKADTSQNIQKLSPKGKAVALLAVVAIGGGLGGRIAEQVIDANGCTIVPGRFPTEPGTTAVASAIDAFIEGVHNDAECK